MKLSKCKGIKGSVSGQSPALECNQEVVGQDELWREYFHRTDPLLRVTLLDAKENIIPYPARVEEVG
jgi:hypothetical protein